MLKKIRNFMDAGDHIEKVHASAKQQSESIKILNDDMSASKEELKALRWELEQYQNSIKTFNDEIAKELAEIRTIKAEYDEELSDLKSFKTRISTTMIDSLMEEFRKALNENIERIKTDAKKYTELKDQLEFVSTNLKQTSFELNKFNTISKTIKEADFELTKHARHLEEQDRHKLELMKNIDTLQRLLGRERRRS